METSKNSETRHSEGDNNFSQKNLVEQNSLAEKDLKYIWHPCSQMKDYEELKPIVVDRGEGVYLYDVDGNRYVDVISSW